MRRFSRFALEAQEYGAGWAAGLAALGMALTLIAGAQNML